MYTCNYYTKLFHEMFVLTDIYTDQNQIVSHAPIIKLDNNKQKTNKYNLP
jgi:hypothetical protein